MKNKVGTYLKMMLWIISSIIIGFLLNYYVTSEIITDYFYGLSSLYLILTVVALIMQIVVVVAGMIYVIYKKDCPRIIVILSLILYGIVMLILLFGRSNAERTINLNILELFSKDAIIHNLLNFIFFIPIGYVLRKKSWVYALICAIVFVAGIESIQLITARGIFDVVDIIIDFGAIILGYAMFKRMGKRKIE